MGLGRLKVGEGGGGEWERVCVGEGGESECGRGRDREIYTLPPVDFLFFFFLPDGSRL